MLKPTQRAVVWGLERLCALLDSMPGPYYDRENGLVWCRHGGYGCWILGLASKSFTLEERWGLVDV